MAVYASPGEERCACMGDEQDRDDRAVGSFEDIVASWKADGTVPEWPDERPAAAETIEPSAPPVAPPAVRPGPAVDPLSDREDHYVPPEPPPLPKLGVAAAVGLVLVALGIILIAAPQWIGMSGVYGLPLGLVAIAGGLTWLLMRLWQPTAEDPRDDEGTV